MEFTLAHGTENDFVVLTDPGDVLELSDALVRALTHRRHGVGADGVIRIGSGGADADAFMDYRNADGSIGEMCGNGVRVTAKIVADSGVAEPDADGVLRIATRAGVKPVRITSRHPDGSVAEVAVAMGTPRHEPHLVPFVADDADAQVHRLTVAPADGVTEAVEVAVVSMGNPHAVTVVDDVAAAPVASLGPAVEGDERFPEGVNVGFVEVASRGAVRLRVWERGVGETSACGTGACAAVAVLQRRGEVDAEVDVHLPGGVLRIGRSEDDGVTLTGAADVVARGVLDDGWVASARAGQMETEH